jgi:hypothetical protein
VIVGAAADLRVGVKIRGGWPSHEPTEISLRFYSFAIPRSTRTRIVASGSAVRFNRLTFSGGGGGGSGSGSGSKANGRLPAPPHHPSRASADGVHRPLTGTRTEAQARRFGGAGHTHRHIDGAEWLHRETGTERETHALAGGISASSSHPRPQPRARVPHPPTFRRPRSRPAAPSRTALWIDHHKH